MGRIIQGEIGIPFPCQLLKTSQTTQYSAKEDDGYFEKGISKKYVVLTLAQYSGTVDIVLNAKTHTLSNNCVYDKRTGLVWARYVPDGDIGPDGDGQLLWSDAANDEDIFSFKDQANTKELGGHADWRVPNVFELLSLADLEETNPAIDTTVFPSTPAAHHWTASTRKGGVTTAFFVTFLDGAYAYYNAKAIIKYYCRLVRGGV